MLKLRASTSRSTSHCRCQTCKPSPSVDTSLAAQHLSRSLTQRLQAATPPQHRTLDSHCRWLEHEVHTASLTLHDASNSAAHNPCAVRRALSSLSASAVQQARALVRTGPRDIDEIRRARILLRRAGAERHATEAHLRCHAISRARQLQSHFLAWKLIKNAINPQPEPSHHAAAVPQLRRRDGTLTVTQYEAATELRTHFLALDSTEDESLSSIQAQVFSWTRGSSAQSWNNSMRALHWRDANHSNTHRAELSVDDILRACLKMKKHRAPDHHGLRSDHFVQNRELATHVCTLFNAILAAETVPEDWKHAVISPFAKPGRDPRLPRSWRPIALSLTLERLFFRCILPWIQADVGDSHGLRPLRYDWNAADDTQASTEDDWLDSLLDVPEAAGICVQQAGFKAHRSCNEQSLTLLLYCMAAMGLPVYMAMLDGSNAYDMIYRHRTAEALQLAGLRDQLRNVLISHSKDTSACVRIGKARSEPFPLTRGVAQGNPVAPIVFNITIDHLSTALESLTDETGRPIGGVEVLGRRICSLQLADDVTLLSSCPSDLCTMIDAASVCLRMEGMQLNASKTTVMCVNGPTGQLSSDVFRDRHLALTSSMRHLGTIIHKNMLWEPHLEHIHSAGTAALRQLYALGARGIDVVTMTTVYKAMVRSVLETGCALWGGLGDSHVRSIDEVQKVALRFITGFRSASNAAPAEVLRGELGLESLQCRRHTAVLRMYFDILSGTYQGLGRHALLGSLWYYLKQWTTLRGWTMPVQHQGWALQVHRILLHYGRAWPATTRSDGPPADNDARKRSLWIGDWMRYDVQQQRGQQLEEDWISDANNMPRLIKIFAHRSDMICKRMLELDKQCAQTDHQHGQLFKPKRIPLRWVQSADQEAWRVAVDRTRLRVGDTSWISPNYYQVKRDLRLEPFLQSKMSPHDRRRVMIWRFRLAWGEQPDRTFGDSMTCEKCERRGVADWLCHWLGEGEGGCRDQGVSELREHFWDRISAAGTSDVGRRVVRAARMALSRGPGLVRVGREEDTIGARLVLHGFISQAERGTSPSYGWYAHELHVLQRALLRAVEYGKIHELGEDEAPDGKGRRSVKDCRAALVRGLALSRERRRMEKVVVEWMRHMEEALLA